MSFRSTKVEQEIIDLDGLLQHFNTSNSMSVFGELYRSRKWSDVTFYVGKKSLTVFEAHTLVLRLGSRVFDELFNQTAAKVHEIFDVEPKEFGIILKFLYTGIATMENMETEDQFAVLRAATKYDISYLVECCEKVLGDSIDEINAMLIYQLAFKHNKSILREKALTYICRYGYKFINSTKFVDLDIKELGSILARDDLRVPTEAHLYDAVINWGRAECKRQNTPENPKYLRSLLKDVIHLIRFPNMDPKDFRARILPANNMLLPEEITAVLVDFSVPVADRLHIPTALFNSKPRAEYAPMADTECLTLNQGEENAGLTLKMVTTDLATHLLTTGVNKPAPDLPVKMTTEPTTNLGTAIPTDAAAEFGVRVAMGQNIIANPYPRTKETTQRVFRFRSSMNLWATRLCINKEPVSFYQPEVHERRGVILKQHCPCDTNLKFESKSVTGNYYAQQDLNELQFLVPNETLGTGYLACEQRVCYTVVFNSETGTVYASKDEPKYAEDQTVDVVFCSLADSPNRKVQFQIITLGVNERLIPEIDFFAA